MFVSLARLTAPRSRRRELGALRRQLRQVRKSASSESAKTLAHRMRELRAEMADGLGEVRSCAGCVRATRPPRRRGDGPPGAFDGGLCCSGATTDVFSAEEVAALALAGTRGRHLRAPSGEHAGCAFRGPRGCSLEAADRPNVCARYLCGELRRELAASGTLLELDRMAEELGELLAEFAREHRPPVQ